MTSTTATASERRADALCQAARAKRQAAVTRAETAIRKLIMDRQEINFRSVARTAGVSLEFLTSFAATSGVATASSATVPATATASASSHPRPAAHPTKRGCSATVKPGHAACLIVQRTDVPGHKGLFAANTAPVGYGPSQLQSAYNLPSATPGAGETVAIVDAFDDPNAEADLQVYRAQYGLPVCDSANGCFTKVAQDGSTNYPPSPPFGSNWDAEISLDLDMVSATCPNCHILLVEANDNTLPNLGTAVDEAVSLGAKYVSNSYGGPEDPSEVTADSSYYNHPGVAITASSGDQGYGVEYPAASQYVTAVGGTTLTQDSTVPRGWSETAWSGAGSGCSAYEAKPSWQTDTGCAMRTVTDVSADADPSTGVAYYDTFSGGGWGLAGGTSVASPIIASTFALAGTPVPGTYPSSYLYTDTSALNDVTSGSNGTCTPAYLCTAGTGYDGPTGLGTPEGTAAFTTGPHGTVAGTVTDASTGKPIADAEVDVGNQQPIHTSSGGTYTIPVPVGSYDVTVKDFGYQSQTVSGAQVTDGQKTTENFALQPSPSVTLTGTVTDGSGHGWPLYAKVSVPGTPASTYTNPATGQYTLTLPENGSYNVTVDAVYPGYIQAQQSVQAGTSNLTQNFGVQMDASTCSAPGYKFNYNDSTQTFDGSTTPSGWTVVNAPSSTIGWEFDDPADLPSGPPLTNNTGGSGNFAVADGSVGVTGPNGTIADTELVSPVVDMNHDSTPYVQFNSDLFSWVTDTENVEVSTDGGQTWTTVWQNLSASGKRGPDLEAIPLPMAAGKSQVQVRFHYFTRGGFWWELDNVFLGNRSCGLTPGGFVEGIVHDGNTGAGVNGATVTSVSSPSQTATTAPMTSDPSIGDGFYYMFVPTTGSQQFTAAKSRYATATETATVAANAITALNLTMQAGQLAITPGSVSSTIAMGSPATRNLTFKDTGKAPVNVKLSENHGGFTMLDQQAGATGAPIQRIKGNFSLLSVKAAKRTGSAVRPAAQPADAPWTAVANYPTGIMDNAAAADATTGLVYSVGGIDDSGNITAAGYVYSSGSQPWTALSPMQIAREAPQAAFINGKLYVTGGWDSNGNPVATTEIYHPSTDTWSTGASIPNAYAGAGVTVLNGKMYVIGGCDANNCGHTDVQIYDPSTNTWSTGASYPGPIAWEGCGGVGGAVYCAGGITSNTTETSAAYAYNPGSDSWSAIAPIPIDLAGMGYSAANGELMLSGGVTGAFTMLTNQGYVYDPSSDSWTALPNSNNADYRGGSACGFYRIGGSDSAFFTPQNFTEQLPGYASCSATDVVPWMSESQATFTLNPGATTTVTVSLNAGDPSVTQPGAYTAGLQVSDDTPYKTSPVGVAMNATPPKSWGKITGTISGLACSGTTGPLGGATVQIDGRATSYTLRTGKNGNYALWLDQSNNPLTLIAALAGWQPQTTTVKIKQGATTTADFALKPGAC